MGSFFVVHGLSWPMARGILIPRPGIEPTSVALEGELLTTGPAEKSLESIGWLLRTWQRLSPKVGLGRRQEGPTSGYPSHLLSIPWACLPSFKVNQAGESWFLPRNCPPHHPLQDHREEGETGAPREHQRVGARFIGAFTALVFIIYTLLILGVPVKCVINIKIF